MPISQCEEHSVCPLSVQLEFSIAAKIGDVFLQEHSFAAAKTSGLAHSHVNAMSMFLPTFLVTT